MMFRKMLLCAALLLVVTGRGAANSQFAVNALGIGVRPCHVRAWAMGNIPVALSDSLRLSMTNPAIPAGFRKVSMSILYYADHRTAEDENGRVSYNSSGFPLFEFLIPFGSRLALGFGYHSDADMGNIRTRTKDLEDPVPYSNYLERHGGVFRVPALLALRLYRDVRVGVRVDNWFLSIEEDFDNEFESSTAQPSRERLLLGGNGTGGTIGLLLPVGGHGHFGCTWSSPVVLTVDSEREGASGVVSSRKIDIGLPARFAAGLTFHLGDRWTAGAQTELLRWEDVEDTLSSAGGYRDVTAWSFGVERIGSGDDPKFLRFPLRAGFRVEPLMYRDTAGNGIDHWAVTIGSGFQMMERRGTCDLGIEYGRIGDRGINGLEEEYIRFLIGITGRESWRKRRSYIE